MPAIFVHVSTAGGWTAAAAIGAGLAALATFVLALLTWRMARATLAVATQTKAEAIAVAEQVTVANRQVEMTQEALHASVRPFGTASSPWRLRGRKVGSRDRCHYATSGLELR